MQTKRIALVTGGMGGIGQAICRELFKNGLHVIAAYNRTAHAALSWQALQKNEGYFFDIIAVDVKDFNSCETMANKINSEIGTVEILVNNAGITRDTSCLKMNKDNWDDVINTNLNSVFYVTRTLINGMKQRHFGRIINISSINGQRGQYGQVNYAAAKAGMHGFTKSLAREMAKYGVTVNTVSPGYVETEMVKSLSPAIREKILTEIPLGRFAEPDEVARVISFLANEKSSYITGANIAINGGHHMY
jgi:acetoacetyl-CoA reductase